MRQLPSSCNSRHSKGLFHSVPIRLLFSFRNSVVNFRFYRILLSGAQQSIPCAPASVPRSTLYTAQKPPAEESAQESDDEVTSQEGAELEEEPATPPRQRKPKLTDRAQMGCYSCGITRSSWFHRWQDSVLAPKLREIQAVRPESEEICTTCYSRALFDSRSAKLSEVRPSLALCSVAN